MEEIFNIFSNVNFAPWTKLKPLNCNYGWGGGAVFCTVIAAAAAVVGSAVAAAVWPCWSRPCPPLPPPPWCWGLMFLWPLLWPWPTPIVETWGMILVTLPTALVRPSRKTKRCPVFRYSGCLTNLKKSWITFEQKFRTWNSVQNKKLF